MFARPTSHHVHTRRQAERLEDGADGVEGRYDLGKRWRMSPEDELAKSLCDHNQDCRQEEGQDKPNEARVVCLAVFARSYETDQYVSGYCQPKEKIVQHNPPRV